MLSTGSTSRSLLDGGVAVGDALRLDALGGVHHQQRALAGGQRAGHLVGKIHVPRRVDDIELIGAAIAGRIAQRHALRLDGDAALPLQIHRIEHLLGHFPFAQTAADLNEAVGERGLAVIDVRDDRKIANMPHISHESRYLARRGKCDAAVVRVISSDSAKFGSTRASPVSAVSVETRRGKKPAAL